MAAPTTTYRMWKRLAERPGGSRLFSVAAMARVPYFASIVLHVLRMEPKWFLVMGVRCCHCADILSPGLLSGSTIRGNPITSDVMAVFELHENGRIQQWREAYDLESTTDQIKAAATR